jgi:hypothetical protein
MQQQILTLLPGAATFAADTAVLGPSYIALRLASDGTITSQLTKEPLQARASLARSLLTTLQGDPFCDGRLCYAPLTAAASSVRRWTITVPVALRWQFSSAVGQVESEVTYPVIEGWPVDLDYSPASGWHMPQALNPGPDAAERFSRLSCATGAALLQARVADRGWTIRVAHQAGTRGCQLVGQRGQADRAAFIWRFGVLLAADALAHRLLPTLPLARPADAAAVGT